MSSWWTRLTPLRLLAAAIVLGLAAALLAYAWPWPGGETASGFVAGLAAGCAFAALLRWKMPDACDAAPPALQRRYLRELMIPMGAYVVGLFVSIWLLKRVEEPALRALVALLPVPPIAFALRAIVRYIRDVDEMQQRIELEAVSIATALVSLAYLAGGFLARAGVFEVSAAAAMIWVFPLICMFYGLVKLVVMRRFQ